MKNIVKIAIVLVLGVVLYACSKDSDPIPQESTSLDVVTTTRAEFGACPIVSSNPYNYVGEIHNELVNTYQTEYPGDVKDIPELMAIVENIARENPRFQAIIDHTYEPVDPQVIIDGVEDFENNFHGVIDKLDISNGANERLKTLVDFMFNSGYDRKEPRYTDVDAYLENFERDVMNSTEYTAEESMIILSATATARHSACYWYNFYKRQGKSGQVTNLGRKAWWKWLIIGVADVGGAIAGASGGPATAVSTGVGASNLANTLTSSSGGGSGGGGK